MANNVVGWAGLPPGSSLSSVGVGANAVDHEHVFHGKLRSGDLYAKQIATEEIRLKGESLDDRLRRIELMLKIPSRNIEIEQKYDTLAELWRQYSGLLESLELIETIRGTK